MKKILYIIIILMSVGCASQQENTTKEFTFSHIATIPVGGMDATEITTYCKNTKRLFTASTKEKAILVFDISDVNQIKKVKTISILPFGGNVNSVAVKDNILAAAIEAKDKQKNGKIVTFNTNSFQKIKEYEVGALPDMVAFSSGGKYILSANEGEPNDAYTNDPKGSVSIINNTTGTTKTLTFDGFQNNAMKLKQQGFRIFGKNANLATDVEPEYITISSDNKKAWITLQENNAIAEVDIQSQKITAIYPLGTKNFNLSSNSLDVSDLDKKIQLNTWNVKGFYLPDAIASTTINDKTYLITANEGDSRDYAGYNEEARVGALKLDAKQFPNAATLQNEAQLGRLKVTTAQGDLDNDGDFDELYAFGSRSFSIWNTNGKLVYDSGNDIAKRTMHRAKSFNQNDSRSDDKGSEPEALEVLKIHGKTLVFVGLERTGGIMVYDISNPKSPKFLQWILNKGDISPEGLLIIPAKDSPTKENMLVVSNEISGTISMFQINY